MACDAADLWHVLVALHEGILVGLLVQFPCHQCSLLLARLSLHAQLKLSCRHVTCKYLYAHTTRPPMRTTSASCSTPNKIGQVIILAFKVFYSPIF